MTEDQYSHRGDKIDSKWKINSWRIRPGRQEKRGRNKPNPQERGTQQRGREVGGGSATDVMIKNDCTGVTKNLPPWQKK